MPVRFCVGRGVAGGDMVGDGVDAGPGCSAPETGWWRGGSKPAGRTGMAVTALATAVIPGVASPRYHDGFRYISMMSSWMSW
jgi:hypothetical protein